MLQVGALGSGGALRPGQEGAWSNAWTPTEGPGRPCCSVSVEVFLLTSLPFHGCSLGGSTCSEEARLCSLPANVGVLVPRRVSLWTLEEAQQSSWES